MNVAVQMEGGWVGRAEGGSGYIENVTLVASFSPVLVIANERSPDVELYTTCLDGTVRTMLGCTDTMPDAELSKGLVSLSLPGLFMMNWNQKPPIVCQEERSTFALKSKKKKQEEQRYRIGEE